MKTVTSLEPPAIPLERSLTMADFSELVKARLTLLVVITTGVGFYLGWQGPINFLALTHAVLGTALAAAGAAALNQFRERDFDALMNRTRARPIPAGRMLPREALITGALLSVLGVAYLAVAVNGFSAFLAGLTVALYVFAYTPLKRISTANTLVGAIPGAIPPVIGWVAAGQPIDLGAGTLFAILFLWQMPHFFALAWMYRIDYARAGFRMMSRDDENGLRSSSQSVLFCIALLIIAGLPSYVGLTNKFYLPIALALSGWFVIMALRFHRERSAQNARSLFLASITYLPLLLAALVLTK
jgi:protoheme IX farnesyltransferase